MIGAAASKPKRAIAVALLAGCGFFAAVALAAEWEKDKNRPLLPAIPAAQGDQCVEPTELMRRRHMDFILHQRDETVHKGIRTEKYRFTNCINCHVQPRRAAGDRMAYPRHVDADHFCSSCHIYSLVSIDCFQCHADRPESFYQNHRRALGPAPSGRALGLADMVSRPAERAAP